jgi:hypothetical protein
MPLEPLSDFQRAPFSPGKVANAESEFCSGGDDGNIVKMLDEVKMTIISPITTSRKPYGIMVLFALGSADNGDDVITLP